MIYKHNIVTIFIVGFLLLAFPVLFAADKADKSDDAGETKQSTEEKAAEESKEIKIEGRIYKGRHLQPRLDFCFVHDFVPEETGKRSSRSKKKSEAVKANIKLKSLYKSYQKQQRKLEKLINEYYEERRKTTEEYRTNPAKSADKPLKSALRDVKGDYEPRIESAEVKAQDAADELMKEFQNLVHAMKLGGETFINCASDAGGDYKAVLPETGTYYILVPELLSLGDGKKGLFFTRIAVAEDGEKIKILLDPEYVFEKNIKF